MGWKSLKEHYGIVHTVQVTQDGICIGSPYIHNIIVISPAGDIVKEDDRTMNDDLARYQKEMRADPDKLRQLVRAKDSFTAAIPVYTYDGAKIIEKFCETPGWPNVTHDGCMMYENTFFADREHAKEAAESNNNAAMMLRRMEISDKRRNLAACEDRMKVLLENAHKLGADPETIRHYTEKFFPSDSPPVHHVVAEVRYEYDPIAGKMRYYGSSAPKGWIDTPNARHDRQCRECGISHIEPGTEIDGDPLCWAEDDLCSRCHDYLHEQLVRDAERYRFLRREWPIDLDNTISGGEELDRAIDSSVGIDVPQTETLERRLAACLAECIDTPLLTGALGGDARVQTGLRLGFFQSSLADRAAELLEEAGI